MKQFLPGACLPVLLLASAAVVGCGRTQTQPVKTDPPEIEVSKPVTQEVTDHEDFTGRVEAVKAVELRARVTGYLLDTTHFKEKEGTEIKEGDVLFEIDPRPYQAEVARAGANLVQAQAHHNRLKADYQRAENLRGRGAMSQEDFDKVAGDTAEAKAAVGVAEASLRSSQLQLDYTKVVAPFDGRLSRSLIDPGNLVRADDTALTTLVTLDPMHAYFDVDERTMLRVRRLIREGKLPSVQQATIPVAMALADEDGFPHKGAINFVDNRVDPGTGTLRVRGVFDNPADPKSRLRLLSPGLFVRVRLTVGPTRPAKLVSESALGTDQGQKFLYVVNDKDEVEYRKVKIGLLDQDLRVIEDGVGPEDRVVVSGLQRVRPGMKVRPKLRTMPARPGQAVPPAHLGAGPPGPSSPKKAQ